LKCMRLVNQSVVEVEHQVSPPRVSHGEGRSGPPRRVSLTVQHGTRFSVLVSPAGSSAPLSNLTAVGSADASCYGRQRQGVGCWEYGWQPFPQHRRLRRTKSDQIHQRGGADPRKFSVEDAIQIRTPTTASGAPHSGCESGGRSAPRDEGEVPVAEGVECLVGQLNQRCQQEIESILIAGRQELPQLDLGEFWSRGSELHASGRCQPCPAFQQPQGCTSGRECAGCHIPHMPTGRSRPTAFKRYLRMSFVKQVGLPHYRGDEAFRASLLAWAGRSRRFQDLLQENAETLLANSSVVRL